MIRYQGRVYRPPSEGDSLILQATLGCSYNECTFCGMYRDKPFRVRKVGEVLDEIAWARDTVGDVRKVFLADGDALIAKPPGGGPVSSIDWAPDGLSLAVGTRGGVYASIHLDSPIS